MSTNTSSPASMFKGGAENFHQLKTESGHVEKLCNKSIKLEKKLEKSLRKYIKNSLVAIRAARKLIKSFPSEEDLLQEIHALVDESFANGLTDLNAEAEVEAEK